MIQQSEVYNPFKLRHRSLLRVRINYKMQQTSDYNKKKKQTNSHIQNKLVVTNEQTEPAAGERRHRGGKEYKLLGVRNGDARVDRPSANPEA